MCFRGRKSFSCLSFAGSTSAFYICERNYKNIFALISQSQSFLPRVAMSLQHDFKELENVALIKLEKVSCVSLAILNGMLNREVSEFAIN